MQRKVKCGVLKYEYGCCIVLRYEASDHQADACLVPFMKQYCFHQDNGGVAAAAVIRPSDTSLVEEHGNYV
jgi:hypothetical protein